MTRCILTNDYLEMRKSIETLCADDNAISIDEDECSFALPYGHRLSLFDAHKNRIRQVPLDDSVRPGGSAPAVTANVCGAMPPVAASVWL